MATVLVADDRHSERQVMADILRFYGHRVMEASNGQDALEAIRDTRPDLVITDILMPGMDGYELVNQLRQDKELSRMPVIFCTAVYLEQEAVELARAMNVNRIITKPPRAAEIDAAVNAALYDSQSDEHSEDEHSEDGQTEDGHSEGSACGHLEVAHRQLVTRKLSEKIVELEETNGKLEREIAERIRVEDDLRFSRERLRALASHIQSSREDERLRISREIHDELGQRLTGLRMGLSWLHIRLPGADAEQVSQREKAEYLIGLVDETIKTVQRLSTELRPQMLDDLGLIPALKWQINDFQTRTGILSVFDCTDPECELDRDHSLGVFRIFQETLTNIARHANASKVHVRQSVNNSTWLLEISDDGCGIDPDVISRRESLGLLGMQERAQLIGGQVEFRRAPESGTTVIVRIPIPASGDNV